MTGHASRPPLQPLDEWDFLPGDDDPEPQLRRAAEDAALHIEAREPMTPAQDPGESDVEVGTDPVDPSAVTYFDDEEPETGAELPPAPEDDHEPDLEELLESQHYAFAPDDATN